MRTSPIRTLVAVDDVIDPQTIETILADPGISVVGVVDQASGIPGLKASGAEVLLVACGAPAGDVVDFVSAATRAEHGLPVVVVCAGSPNGFVGDVLTSGADDIVLVDAASTPGPDTFFAMQKALARRTGGGTRDGQGSLVCVLGPKGGIGKTLTATNLGVALADAGHRTVVVDLDLQFGDAGLALGLQPERTIYDLATSGGVLDAEKVDGFLAEHESGLHVLLAPVRPDQAAAVSVEFLRELYATLTKAFAYVVVDTPPGFTPEVIATIDAATSICMMGMLDAPSLKNTKLGMETLGLMGYPLDRVRMVLNRADSNVGISHADVVAVLGRPPDVLIPSQREVVRHINAGQPIVTAARRSEPAKALRALSDLVIADTAPPPSPASNNGGGRRPLLRRR
ncbi:MAG: AAA family ATPase [Solirubrobacteraceae bacterium]